MLKFIGLVVVVSASFAAGYYVGQRPVGTLMQRVSDLQQSITGLSRNVLETTTGIEHDLRRRQGLVDAKSRLVQAKAHVLEHNFGEAAKELGDAVEALDGAAKGVKSDETLAALRELTGSVREVRLEVARGKSVSLKKLNSLQRRLDQLLNR